eukprot:scaffold35065_cov23-Tisochrysis_lutea.AAC.1
MSCMPSGFAYGASCDFLWLSDLCVTFCPTASHSASLVTHAPSPSILSRELAEARSARMHLQAGSLEPTRTLVFPPSMLSFHATEKPAG